MRKQLLILLAVVFLLSACSLTRNAPQPQRTMTPVVVIPNEISVTATTAPSATVPPTSTVVRATATPAVTATPAYPAEGRGPDNFAKGIDPLTGLQVTDPQTLNRRPVVIKVENIPREHRPQWGLSLADIVYEYYTEFGATRFAAVFYGNNAERVGPIRSGRFFDVNVVQMYKAVLVYGSAYTAVQNRFFNSDFANRLILETNKSCPGLCRYEPNGQNLLVANTDALMSYLKSRGVDNSPQNLNGMFFQMQPPANGGVTANTVYVRYSGAIYNRWDYDPVTNRYLRFADKQNDVDRKNEVYAQLTDRLTNQPIAADTMVTLCAPYSYYVKKADSEVLEIFMDPQTPAYVGCDGQQYMGGNGVAYVARDGKMYKVGWKRAGKDQLLTLVNADGSLFPFKPGQTWFEVIGASSTVVQQPDGSWRFTHLMVP